MKYEFHYIKNITDVNAILKKFKGGSPLKRVLQLVVLQNCKTIIEEKGFKDPIFNSEYRVYYSKLFKKYPNNSIALHFFSKKIDKKDINKINQYNDDYLGFCSIRPLETKNLSFALIKPIPDKNYPKKKFVVSKEKFNFKLNGKDLSVEGFPFIQQDGHAGSCAHASLLMIAKFLYQKGLTNRDINLEDIINITSRVPDFSRQFPTPGLNVPQVTRVLKEMKMTPLVYTFGKKLDVPFPPERVIYHYLESNLPIILAISTASAGHALVAVGHTFDPDLWWTLAQMPYYKTYPSGGRYHCSTSWIQNFIIQDDNFGPYLDIPIDFLLSQAVNQQLAIIVPLPEDIFLKGEDAEIYSHRLLHTKLVEEFAQKDNDNKWAGIFFNHLKRDDLVLRTFLKPSSEFKNEYIKNNVTNKLQPLYNDLKLPKYIWITEISIPEIFGQHRLKLGEIINDPTCSLKLDYPAYLAIHLPGFVIIRDPKSDKPETYIIKPDDPHIHLMR